jgi:hypothetical protein
MGLSVTGLLLALTGCGGAEPVSMTGTFRIETGGAAYHSVPGNGMLIVLHGTRLAGEAKVASGGKFQLPLPVGSYQVTSSCPQTYFPLVHAGQSITTTAVRHGKEPPLDVTCIVESAVG